MACEITTLSIGCIILQLIGAFTFTSIDPHVDRLWQQIAIARLPRLRILDGTSVGTFYPDAQSQLLNLTSLNGSVITPPIHFKVSQRQRVDAELLYLSRIAQEWFPSDTVRAAAHPRWTELCKG
jgi:hypothetical protein